MNWKLVGSLSLLGIAIGFAGVYLVAAKFEAIIDMPVFLFCAWYIARHMEMRHFIHGFFVGLISKLWVVAVHVTMVDKYLGNHPGDAMQYGKMATEAGGSTEQVMILMGVFMAVVSGLVSGLFALAAGRFVRTMSGERK